MRYLMLLAVLLTGCATHIRPHQEPTKARIGFHVNRYIARAGQPVRLSVFIYDSDEELWCPGVRWTWPDETTSYEESDCPPFDGQDSGFQGWEKLRRFPPGEWEIAVELVKAERVIRRLTLKLTVVE